MKYIIFILFVSMSYASLGQYDYLVLLKDKNNSPFSIQKPSEFLSQRSVDRRNKQNIEILERDLPVNPNYISEISETGAKVRYTSKWLNAVLINTDIATLNELLKLDIVNGIYENKDLKGLLNSSFPKNRRSKIEKFNTTYSTNLASDFTQINMIGADIMHDEGIKGDGVWIGVLDSGFSNTISLSFFEDLVNDNRIISTWDFVDDEANVYNDHSHGTNVLSCMAAIDNGRIVGTAPNASYVLYKTEDVRSESRLEEVNWLIAAERADSLGVDIINTSLGYNTFDNPAQDYTADDLNGNTSLITKAADWASETGILVVTSAGNDGNTSWKFIGMPADGDLVLSVAAVNANKVRVGFSSYGVPTDTRIKPEVAAQGGGTVVGTPNNILSISNGTSFSAPIIAGFAASLMQAYPDLSAQEIKEIIMKSGSQFNNPDIFTGYGIPHYSRVKALVLEKKLASNVLDNGIIVFPNPIESGKTISAFINDKNTNNIYNINLFDAAGKIHANTTSDTNFFSLEIPKYLSAGNYFIKVSNQTNKWSTSILIFK